MAKRLIDADALKSYINKEYGTQFSPYVLRAICSAIDKQPEVDAVELLAKALLSLHERGDLCGKRIWFDR